MTYDHGYCTVTSTASAPCPHANGWYVTVKFLWIYSKRIFVCSDCGESRAA